LGWFWTRYFGLRFEINLGSVMTRLLGSQLRSSAIGSLRG
jgi:hypothetical protein